MEIHLQEDFLNRMRSEKGFLLTRYLDQLQLPPERALFVNRSRLPLCDKGPDLSLLALPFHLERVPYEEDGYYYPPQEKPGRHPLHEAGLYYIQEPSAMLPVSLLDPQPGDCVLDLCAAPGGKTVQISCRMSKRGGGGILISNEFVPERARILARNVERMGLRQAVVLNEDSGRLAARLEASFDKILVDAPCSGEGMFRKNPDAAKEWSLENVIRCVSRQKEILENAAKMLKPGGILVYSTCTFEEVENEGQVGDFLRTHPDFFLEKEERFLPYEGRGEGHFAARLKKAGSLIPSTHWPCGKQKAGGKEEIQKVIGLADALLCKEAKKRLFSEFVCSAESHTPAGCRLPGEWGMEKSGTISTVRFGDQIYLAPPDSPDLSGLRVLQPGVAFLQVKKNREEPSHALSHLLLENDVYLSVELSAGSSLPLQYLQGMTIQTSDAGCHVLQWKADKSEKTSGTKAAWCLVLCEGVSLGFGKLVGGVLKNHYPKGLRIQC